MDNQRSRADRLRSLHQPAAPLVLINVWDVASAKAVASTGATALATSSAAMAWMLGAQDGMEVAADGFFEMVELIAAAVAPLPLTVDIEAGFGSTPAQVAATVRRVVRAGAVGVNIEDRYLPEGGPGPKLFDLSTQQIRLRAARAAADALGIPLVINARTDVYLSEVGDPAERMSLVIERAAAYRAAGADCVFVPGPRDAGVIAALVAGVEGPLNVLAVPGSPPLPELTDLGVARISLGSWPARAMLGLLQRIAHGVVSTGWYTQLEGALSYPASQTLLATDVTAPPPAAADTSAPIDLSSSSEPSAEVPSA